MPDFLVNVQACIEALDRIEAVPIVLEVVCHTTGMGFAAVARVTPQRWVACAVRDEIAFGLTPGGELQVETTICHEIRQGMSAVIIDDVAADAVYCNHHTPEKYGFQSYISFPIILKDGSFFGTLCAIDPKPADLNNPKVTGMFKLFAELLAFHLDNINARLQTEAALEEERHSAQLRDQFIAILGHDLKNPIGAINNVAQILLRMPVEERVTRLAHILRDSSLRMKVLIDNILDFARGRLGEGIAINCKADEPIHQLLEQIVAECHISWPEREIITEYAISQPVNCDGRRIAQLFANLLNNALQHGKKDGAVIVKVTSDGGEFSLAVTNSGGPIPEDARARLFQPFYRGDNDARKQGLGLGLYIVSEIAGAHGGFIEVSTDADVTTFALRMPNYLPAED